jgi:hypothetical protein
MPEVEELWPSGERAEVPTAASPLPLPPPLRALSSAPRDISGKLPAGNGSLRGSGPHRGDAKPAPPPRSSLRKRVRREGRRRRGGGGHTAEVCPLPDAGNGVRGLVAHVVAGVGVLLLDPSRARRALHGTDLANPSLELVHVDIHRAPLPLVAQRFALRAEDQRAALASHEVDLVDSGVGQRNECRAADASHAISVDRPVVVVEILLKVLRGEELLGHGRGDCGCTSLAMQWTAKREERRVCKGSMKIRLKILDTEGVPAGEGDHGRGGGRADDTVASDGLDGARGRGKDTPSEKS